MFNETESHVVQAVLNLLYMSFSSGSLCFFLQSAGPTSVRPEAVPRHSHFSYSNYDGLSLMAHFLQRITSPSPSISGNTQNIAIVFWETVPPAFLPQISGFATVLFLTHPLACSDEHHHYFCNWLWEVVDTPAEKSHKPKSTPEVRLWPSYQTFACKKQIWQFTQSLPRSVLRGSQPKLTLRTAQTGPPEILQTSDDIPVLSSTKGKVQYNQSPVQLLLKSGKFPWVELAIHFLELWPRVIISHSQPFFQFWLEELPYSWYLSSSHFHGSHQKHSFQFCTDV